MTIQRDWPAEVAKRIDWIRRALARANAKGVILGLSGGKDSAVVAALAKLATDNVLCVMMPCNSLAQDTDHALLVADKFQIKTIDVNLSEAYRAMSFAIIPNMPGVLTDLAAANIKPRLRMTTLYAIGQSLGYLVAGTSNLDEITVGYSTKWGDSGCDFNVLGDLRVEEVIALGRYLGVPETILVKAPSAGLWEGQTDEEEMGLRYADIDKFLRGEWQEMPPEIVKKIQDANARSAHKRRMPPIYPEE